MVTGRIPRNSFGPLSRLHNLICKVLEAVLKIPLFTLKLQDSEVNTSTILHLPQVSEGTRVSYSANKWGTSTLQNPNLVLPGAKQILTVGIHFLLLKLFKKVLCSPLWVGARHHPGEILQQLLQAREVRGFPEVLRTLVKPGPQDGGNSTGKEKWRATEPGRTPVGPRTSAGHHSP